MASMWLLIFSKYPKKNYLYCHCCFELYFFENYIKDYKKIMKKIDKIIHEKFPKWTSLSNENKLLNFIEIDLFLIKEKKWNIRVSNAILKDQSKLSKINEIVNELRNGQNIWHRLSNFVIESYINLPQTLIKRNKNKFYGKDLLLNLLNIHHLKINSKLSNKKISLFDKEISFVDTNQDELLFIMFDERFNTSYLIDLLKHNELYKYQKLLNTILEENFPQPFSNHPELNIEESWSDDEIKNILFKGGNLFFKINNYTCSPLNKIRSSGHTDKIINIYNQIMNDKTDIMLPCDFFYKGQIYNELYKYNIEQFNK